MQEKTDQLNEEKTRSEAQFDKNEGLIMQIDEFELKLELQENSLIEKVEQIALLEMQLEQAGEDKDA